jgi:hypothetical protein
MRRCLLLVLLASLGTAACASTPSGISDRMAAPAPMLSVERFLQAANSGDLEAMAYIFGTARGPIAGETGSSLGCAFRRVGSWFGAGRRCVSWSDIELRMNAIALIIRHDDYRVRSQSNVPGRTRPTTRVGVDLDRGSSRYSDVPFVVVQTSDGRWLVEEIGLERITALRGPAPSPLHELPKDTPRAVRMQEGHEMPAGPWPRFPVDETESPVSQLGQSGVDVGHSIREVV